MKEVSLTDVCKLLKATLAVSDQIGLYGDYHRFVWQS